MRIPEDDGYDGVQYDDFWACSTQQLEAEEIRRDFAAEEFAIHMGNLER
jgi:hypothetical protein